MEQRNVSDEIRVWKFLKDEFPDIVLWHCLNHRLELAVDNALNATSGTNDLQFFIESLYSLYSQSLTNMRELSDCGPDLDISLKKNRKDSLSVFIFQSGISSEALFSSLSPTFWERFKKWNSKSAEKARFQGLLFKSALMANVFNDKKNLSETLQNRNTTLPKTQNLLFIQQL